MENTELERVKKLCKYLIYRGFANNEKELAVVLGYAKTSFSQFMNGKKPITDSFKARIEALDPNVNKGYISSGEIPLLKNVDSDRIEELTYLNIVQQKLIKGLEDEILSLKKELKTLNK